MTGSIRKVAFLAVCGLFSASAAMAGVPSAATSVVGSFIRLGGSDIPIVMVNGTEGVSGTNAVEPQVNKIITVNDAGGSPVQNSTVELRFGVCTSTGEFRICGIQPHPGVGVSCVDKAVIAVTDVNGNAEFRIVGGALNPGGGAGGVPAAGLNEIRCVEVRADGIVIGNLRAKAYDQNNVNGVNPVDLSLFLNDRFNSSCVTATWELPFGPNPVGTGHTPDCASYRSRSDYNDDGAINPVDLSLFLSVRFANKSLNSCPAPQVCAP